MTAGLPLVANLLALLTKSVLIPLGLTVAAWTTDAAFQKKIYGSGTTALTISNEEMDYIMKIVQLLEESGPLTKGISETIKNKAKEQKGWLSGIRFERYFSHYRATQMIMLRIFKRNMRTFTETIRLTDKMKFRF